MMDEALIRDVVRQELEPVRQLIRQLQGAGPLLREQVAVTWPGGSAQSNFVTVTHDLGAVAGAIATLHGTGAVNTGHVSTLAHTITDFALVVTATFSPPAGAAALIDVLYWKAA
jgi:hypothetical protein